MIRTLWRWAPIWFGLLTTLGLTSPVPAQEVTALSAQTVAAIVAGADVPRAGATHPDVLLVEYLDYNCGYCKRMAPEMQRLLKSDPHVAVLVKEWPIFGDASIYAAQSALAANWQGKFLVAHEALISAPNGVNQHLDVDRVLRAAGIDMERLAADRRLHASQIKATLARSERETGALDIKGTPAIIAGRILMPSALTLAQLQQLVAIVRSAGHS